MNYSWSTISTVGLIGARYSLATSATTQYMAFVDLFSANIYISNDYGQSFAPISASGTTNAFSIAMSSSGQYVLATFDSGTKIFLSNDYGNTFNDISSNISPSFEPPWLYKTLTISPSSSPHFAALITSDLATYSLTTSMDYGITWNVQTFFGNGDLYSAVYDSNSVLYYATSTGIYKTPDYTSNTLLHSFTSPLDGTGNWDVHLKCSSNGNIILCTIVSVSSPSSTILLSTNGGASFSTIAPPTAGRFSSFVSGNGSLLMLGMEGGYVYTSTNSGASWNQEDPPLGAYYQPTGSACLIASSADASKLVALRSNNTSYHLASIISSAPTVIDGNNNIVTSPTTWGNGSTLAITVPATVQSGTLTLDVPSISTITGAGSITVEPGASIAITGPTGTRTMTVEQGHRYKLDPSNT